MLYQNYSFDQSQNQIFSVLKELCWRRVKIAIMGQDNKLYIYSNDLGQLLLEHDVTWSKHDSYCKDQYASNAQPEEHELTTDLNITIVFL